MDNNIFQESPIELLNEVLISMSEQYENYGEFTELFNSTDFVELVSITENALTQNVYESIADYFSNLIKSVESGETDDILVIEEEINILCSQIEKHDFHKSIHINDGVYFSENEELNIGVEWSGKSAVRHRNHSVSAHQRSRKKNTEEDKTESTKNETHSLYEKIITLDTTIEELDLSVREFNCLKKSGIMTICDLILYADSDSCCMNLDKKCPEEIIRKLKDQGVDIEKLKLDYLKQQPYVPTNKVLTLDSPIEDLMLSERAYRPLKREKVKIIRDVLKFFDGTTCCRSLGRKGMDEIIDKLLSNRLITRTTCISCDTILSVDDMERGSDICEECLERLKRTLTAKDIVLEVLPPEKSSYSGNSIGFHIYINIKNNTHKPVKLGLKECMLFKNNRQNKPDFNLTGYVFSEDYIFPSSIKTFAKIWITDTWIDKDISCSDYLTISFENLDNGEIYYYKFDYSTTENNWSFTDYYKIC